MANNSDGGIVLSVSIDSSEVSSDMKKVVAEINKQVQAEAKNLKSVESVNQAKEKTTELQAKANKAVWEEVEAEAKAEIAEEKKKREKAFTRQEQAKIVQEEEKGLQAIADTEHAQEKLKQSKVDTEKKINDLRVSEEKVTQAVDNTQISHEKLDQSILKSAKDQERVHQAINNSILSDEKLLSVDGGLEQSKKKQAEAQERLADVTSNVAERQEIVANKVRDTIDNADDLTESQQKLEQAVNQTAMSEERRKQTIIDTSIKQEELTQATNETAISNEKVYQAEQKSAKAKEDSLTAEEKKKKAQLEVEKKQQDILIAEQKLSQEIEKGYQAEEKTRQAELKTQQEQQKTLINEEKIKQEKEKTQQAEEKHKQAVLKTEKAQNSLKNATSKTTQVLKKMASMLGVAFGIREILTFSNEASKLASTTEASVQRLSMLYGESAQDVYDWANENANAFGMSKTAAYQAAAAYGNIFTTFADGKESADLTKDVLQATAVIASQTGRTYDETFEKIQSGLYGNTRAIDDLGISVRQSSLMQTEAYKQVSQNGQKSWNDLTDAELQQVRALAIVEQSTTKYGNSVLQTTALTRSQFSSAFEDFKATFGQVVNIVLMPVLRVLTKIMNVATMVLQSVLRLFGKEITAGASSMQSIGDSASGVSDSIDDATDSQKSYNKELNKSLAGFDELQTLQTDSGGSSGGGGSAVSPVADSGLDVATQGIAIKDIVDNGTLSIWDEFLGKLKEIRDIFMSGFWKSFKNADFSGIKESISSIGKSFKDIFGSEEVVNSSKNFSESLVEFLGSLTGSIASIGKTIAENLLGGFSGYLSNNQEFIRDRITGIFDVSAEIFDLFSDLSESIADIFSTFAGENGISLTENVLGIFGNLKLSIIELALQIGKDFISYLSKPITENTEELSTALDGVLGFVSDVTEGIKELVDNLSENIIGTYKDKISPLFDVVSDTISNIVGNIIDKWNLHIQPVLDTIGEEFKELVEVRLKPMFDKIFEFIGEVSDVIKPLWEKILGPLVEWIWNIFVSRILRAGKNILLSVWDVVKNIISFVSNLIENIVSYFSGIIKFFKGIFKGDFELAMEGLIQAVKAPINQMINFVEFGINGIIDILNIFATGLDNLVGGIGDVVGKEWSVPHIDHIDIPRLAKGAVIPANREFLAVLGDQKSGTNIEAPAKLIKQMTKEAIAELGIQGQGTSQTVIPTVNVPVYLNSRQIAFATREAENEIGTQTVIGGFANAY